jgi:hypothetical protein
MKPSEIRRELLVEHAGLRALLEKVCEACDLWSRDERACADAGACLACLRDELNAHNEREEELLHRVIPNVDAWGAVRAVMSQEHMAEHGEVDRELADAAAEMDAKVILRRTRAFRDRMLAHMEREERTFLGEDVLHDDGVHVDSFGG